jgi:hypothetical protein
MRPLEEQLGQARLRAKAAQNSLSAIKDAMAAQGLVLRPDMLEAESHLNFFLGNAQQAIAIADAVKAEHELELAENAIALIDTFLGR